MKEEDTDRLHLLAMRVNCTRQHISFGSVKIGLIFTTKDPASLLGWKDLPLTCNFRLCFMPLIFTMHNTLCLGRFLFFQFTNSSLSPCTAEPVLFSFYFLKRIFFPFYTSMYASKSARQGPSRGPRHRPGPAENLSNFGRPSSTSTTSSPHLAQQPDCPSTCAGDDTYYQYQDSSSWLKSSEVCITSELAQAQQCSQTQIASEYQDVSPDNSLGFSPAFFISIHCLLSFSRKLLLVGNQLQRVDRRLRRVVYGSCALSYHYCLQCLQFQIHALCLILRALLCHHS